MRLETWKRSQNMQVVTRAEGAIVGRLEDFQFDLEDHRIYGWHLKVPGMFARTGRIRADKLLLIGQDVAILSSQADVDWTNERKQRHAPGRAWASAYLGVSAVTRRGRTLGAVQDYLLEREGGRITGLVLHGERLVPLRAGVSTGPGAVVVPSEELVVEMPPEPSPEEERGFWRRLRESVGVSRRERKAEEGDAAPGDLVPVPPREPAGEE